MGAPGIPCEFQGCIDAHVRARALVFARVRVRARVSVLVRVSLCARMCQFASSFGCIYMRAGRPSWACNRTNWQREIDR